MNTESAFPYMWKKVRSNFKWILVILFLLGMFLVSVAVHFKQQLQLEYAQSVFHRQSEELNGVKQELTQKINEKNQQETKVIALEGTNEQLKMLIQAKDKYFTEQLNDLKLAVSQVQSITNLRVESSGQFVTVTRDTIIQHVRERTMGEDIQRDTIRERLQLINYREPSGWFEMKGTIKGDSVFFNPIFYDEYTIAVYSEKKPKKYFLDLFPGKQTVGKVISKNPYTRTNNMRVIVKKPEKRRFLGIF